ncbi:YcgN family cysteine cluster protein [Pseudovibrio sp. Ad26]|uniref:YcgN family cysteine cluster protein n=1 Tax=Pseudovibrio sp. Ad26 TaxID=989410 RepID=UPI001AD92F40|nr:YcgN family cysteine cluster protein [Pseudovibrio sp. Ad26]
MRTTKMVSVNSESHRPFWQTKTLDAMTHEEWESLCDGCGRCCLNKLEDWDTGAIYWTNVACTLLDGTTCRCKNYEQRFDTVPDCVQLSPETVRTLKWLPPTCAYRLIREGRDLYWWHPLVSKDPQSVHDAGISVQDKTISEDGMEPEEFENYLVDWPDEEYTKD